MCMGTSTAMDIGTSMGHGSWIMGMGNATAVSSEASAFSTPTHGSVELLPSSFASTFGSEDSVVDADFLKD